MFRGSPNRKILVARKVISLLVLGGLLLASIPIPLGLKVVHRVDSTPFPCMDCACGCATPEQCWTSCCCFTPAERERWAEQHGVAPPSYAVLSLSGLSKPAASGSAGTACGSSRCSLPDQEDCLNCSSASCVAGGIVSPCSTPAGSSCATTGDGQQASESHAVTVLSVVALRCQGASSQFTLLPWAIVELDTVDVSSPEVIVDPYLVFSEAATSLGIAPATPPPKC